MKKNKLITIAMAAAMSMSLLAGCTKTETPAETPAPEETVDVSAIDINIGVLKGPTGMGAIKLMDDAETGVYPNYHFTLTPEPTDIVAKLSNGDLAYYTKVMTVFGHKPTKSFGKKFKGQIVYTDTWIDIDVGAAYGEEPVLLRLDDMKEFRSALNSAGF